MFSSLLLLLPFLQWVACIQVISPQQIHSEWPQVGLIIAPGANLSSVHYVGLAQSLAKSSGEWGFDLHVALVDSVLGYVADPITIKPVIRKAVLKLSEVMPVQRNKNVFLAGHSMGGIAIKDLKSDYAGFLMYGAFLKSKEVSEWSTPVLQVTGERDGQMRMTHMASLLKEFQSEPKGENTESPRFPLVILQDITHSSFTNIPRLQNWGVSADLPPILTEEEGYRRIAEVTLAFIAAKSPQSLSTMSEGQSRLEKLSQESDRIVDGYLKALSMDVSELCRIDQAVIAGNAAEGIETTVNVYDGLLGFAFSKPEFKDNTMTMTAMLSKAKAFPPGRSDKTQAPETLACKGESGESLAEKRKMTLENGAGCKEVMEKMLSIAKDLLTPEQKQRLEAVNAQVLVGESLLKNSGMNWLPAGVEFKQDGKQLTVSPVEMKVPMTSRVYPGKHYCKVLHPARLLEYMIIEAFY